ncbi:MAG: PIN domain-containing protein [Parcubacteria group bacterium]|jgi:hypothetical protein
MLKKTVKKEYIFIDTNLYRDLLISETLAKEILPILKKLSEDIYIILIPQQVLDEINRNRYEAWTDGNFNFKRKHLEQLTEILQRKDIQELRGSKALLLSANKKIKKLDKDSSCLFKNLTSPNGKSAKIIKELLSFSTIISDSKEITEATESRIIKGNPPFDKGNDRKNCDRYIWEALLSYFEIKKIKKPVLSIFTKNINDYCIRAGDKCVLNPFLADEFRKKFGGKLSWSDNLQALPSITPEEKKVVQEAERKIAEDDKLKLIEEKIVLSLRNSNSWDQTDSVMLKTIAYIPEFHLDTIINILHAANDNASISFGPYNQVIDASEAYMYFAKLYKRSQEIGVPLNEWKQFYVNMDENQQKRFIKLRKSLENKGQKFSLNELKYYMLEDLPF